MKNLNVISDGLNKLGFITKIEDLNVQVSLNRPLDQWEVRDALDYAFNKEVVWYVTQGNNGFTVLVR